MEKSTQKHKIIKQKSGKKIAGRENVSLFRENNLQCLQCKQEELTEEEETKQQQKIDAYREISGKENQIKSKDGCQKPMVGLGDFSGGL